MTHPTPQPADLAGTADERLAQLARLESSALSPEWLRRQLESALSAWEADETKLDIDVEARTDF